MKNNLNFKNKYISWLLCSNQAIVNLKSSEKNENFIDVYKDKIKYK